MAGKVLTDTHTLVWALSNPQALGLNARAALETFPFTASAANLWELILNDRILIAQALSEGLTLLTKDAIIGTYGVPTLW